MTKSEKKEMTSKNDGSDEQHAKDDTTVIKRFGATRLQTWRNEILHSRCFISPVLLFTLVMIIFLSVVLAVSALPQIMVGFVLSLIITKGDLLKLTIEHLYPCGIGRWLHLWLLRFGDSSIKKDGTNNKPHSRTLETRFEVIKEKVYIHCVPQLLDNLCYVIVYLKERKNFGGMKEIKVTIVDCSDAVALEKHLRKIQNQHYTDLPMEVTSVLCTHKHHDHTAGNRLLASTYVGLKIYGGAIESIPYVTDLVKNGDILEKLSLPKECSIVAIASPGHTRGSIVYKLQNIMSDETQLFTGDAMFCGGSGNAFESLGNAASTVTERCFANILTVVPNPKLCCFFPGHEYAKDLLSMQFQNASSNNTIKSSDWKHFSPHDFFETAGHFLVAYHRRELPSGKRTLTIPCSLEREMVMNPQFRQLRLYGESLLHALRLWIQSKGDVCDLNEKSSAENHPSSVTPAAATMSTPSTWNIGMDEVNHSVFTTVYTDDLQKLIQQLQGNNKMSNMQVAAHLQEMICKMRYPITQKSYNLSQSSSVNGTSASNGSQSNIFSPQNKLMKDAITALSILGSPPQALTFSDSIKMNLPPPLLKGKKCGFTPVRYSRLVKVMEALGLMKDPKSVKAINVFFNEALRRKEFQRKSMTSGVHPTMESIRIMSYSNVAYESFIESGNRLDESIITLQELKNLLIGKEIIERTTNSIWAFSCLKNEHQQLSLECHEKEQKITTLIYHDMSRCFLCKDNTGCPLIWSDSKEEKGKDLGQQDPSPTENN